MHEHVFVLFYFNTTLALLLLELLPEKERKWENQNEGGKLNTNNNLIYYDT